MEEISKNQNTYKRFSFRSALNLCAPHTWPSSILPVLLAFALAYSNGYAINIFLTIDLLVISVFLQSAVNCLNDYFDFIKGTDSENDAVDKDDAVLIYDSVNPKCARNLSVSLIIASFILGIYPIYIAGLVPLIIAIIGAIVILLYSGGKTPISYLPLGEAVSGIVMGFLITFASYVSLTKDINWFVALWSLPLVFGIALVMLTNNGSDIEKDTSSGRRTLPVVLGRHKSVILYKTLVALMICDSILNIAIWYQHGLIVVLFMLLVLIPYIKISFSTKLMPEKRIQSMSSTLNLLVVTGIFYICCIVF